MSTDLTLNWLDYSETELIKVRQEIDDEMDTSIPCCQCGKLTTWDPTYQNLCYRCCRAANE